LAAKILLPGSTLGKPDDGLPDALRDLIEGVALKMTDVKVPDGYHRATPIFIAKDAPRLIDFIEEVFGAQEKSRVPLPDGTIAHAELTLGDSSVIVEGQGQPGLVLYVFVQDVDAAHRRAVEAGAISLSEPEDRPYGHRNSEIRDPFGNVWRLATQLEALTDEEQRRRFDDANR
jgi:PhnB protein